MFDYKILEFKKASDIEEGINIYSKQGYKVVSVIPFTRSLPRIIVTMEREI